MIAPSDLRARLPAISDDWKGFTAPHPDDLARIQSREYADQLRVFEAFEREIAACDRPCLYFGHFILPHVPWYYTPSGRVYYPNDAYGIRRPEGRWGADDWWVLQGYQRHLFQVALVDRLLGRTIEALQRRGLYDRALVVVTSDHGASFWPGASRRLLDGQPHPGDLLRVPLLIKAPGQRQGAIRDVPIETIDVLPTIADLLGIDPGWRWNGVSVAAADATGREIRIAHGMDGVRHEYGTREVAIDASLARKLSAWGDGDRADGPYAFGPHRGLVGRSVSSFALAPVPGLTATIASEPFDRARGASEEPGQPTPARITGRIDLPAALHGEQHIAVSDGGVIQAVAPTYRTSLASRVFSVFVPDSVFRDARAELAFVVVSGPPENPVLHPADPAFAPILPALRRHLAQDPDELRR